MTDSKIISFRVNEDLSVSFKHFCTKNELSTKDVLVPILQLLIDADKSQNSGDNE